MAFIEWTDTLSVGIPSIDTQHQKLVSLLNQLHEAMRNRQGKEILDSLFKELLDYTKYHFQAEETLFDAHGYPGAEMHKTQHRELIAEAERLQSQFESGELLISVKVLDFLKRWVAEHIQESDKRYQDFFLSKGIR
jgi:hemerythrin-like metal-binding protein